MASRLFNTSPGIVSTCWRQRNRVGTAVVAVTLPWAMAVAFSMTRPSSASASTTYNVTASIPVGGGPNGAGVDPNTGTVYVPNTGHVGTNLGGTVSVIDEKTNTVTQDNQGG